MHRFVTALAALCAPVALATDDYRTTIWVTPTYIATLPVTGLAWDNLECFASKDFDYSDQDAALFPNLSNLNSHADMLALAKALVWKRTGGMSGEYAHYRCEIRDAIMGIPAGPGCCAVVEEEEICNSNSLMGTECWGGDNSVCDNSSEDNVLPTARNLPGWIIAAGLVTLHATDRIIFENWLNGEYGLPTKQIGGSNDTLSLTHDRRPNNHGTCAGAALAAIAYYTDDEDLMAAVASVFHEYTGETPVTASAWGGHGATCWQPENNNPNNYVYGINPPGAQVKIPPVTGTLRDCDGVLPDDQRRCDQGGCPCTTGTPTCTTCIGGSEAENSGALLWDDTTGPPEQGYVYGGLQGIVVQAQILDNYYGDDTIWTSGDDAIMRAFEWLDTVSNFEPAGDDRFLTWVVKKVYCCGSNCNTCFVSFDSENAPSSTPSNCATANPGSFLIGKNMGFTDWTHATCPACP